MLKNVNTPETSDEWFTFVKMRKTSLSLLVVLMAISVLLLIGAQAYWLRESFRAEKERLDATAIDVLDQVVLLHAKRESAGQLLTVSRSLLSKDTLMQRVDTAMHNVRQVIMRNEHVHVDSKDSMQGAKKKVVIIRDNVTDDLEKNVEVKSHAWKEEGQSGDSWIEDTTLQWLGKDNERMQMMLRSDNRYQFIEEILVEMTDTMGHVPSVAELMAIKKNLSEGLKERGIDGKFDFISYDEKSGEVQMSDGALTPSTVPYRTRLYPQGLIPSYYMVGLSLPDVRHIILGRMGWLIGISVLLSLLILFAFYLALSRIVKQKKLDELKTDFINNLTHEFRTPVSTIKLASEALQANAPGLLSGGMLVDVIRNENERMHRHIERVLELLRTERPADLPHTGIVDLNAMLSDMAHVAQVQVATAQGSVKLQLCDEQVNVKGDEVMLYSAIKNIVDNAIKFSKQSPEIIMQLAVHNGRCNIKVSDKGIGIAQDKLQKIFEKFYRADTGAVQTAGGLGIGLSFVKNIIIQHGGSVRVESIQGQGATFIIELPIIIQG